MSSQRIPRRALFADAGTGCKKRCYQCMTWCRGVKESYKGLASVFPSRLPGWGPRDGATQWVETLSDIAQNRSQWRSFCFVGYMELLYHEDIPIDLITEQLIGCKCENICRLEDNCTCLSKSGMSYDMNGLLTNFMNPIFECNSECVCSQSCTNRVVQRYLNDAEFTFESEYHTKTYVTNHPVMGRGLKAACEIQRGELVCVYLGEVIPYKEACLREALQLSCYGRNFIMIMREYSNHHLVSETCVDGNSESWGSVKSKARLINHSCTPNLTVVPVRVDSFIPYLALFANKVIFEGTQLSYDYAQSVPSDKIRLSNTLCLCSSDSCRVYMPGV